MLSPALGELRQRQHAWPMTALQTVLWCDVTRGTRSPLSSVTLRLEQLHFHHQRRLKRVTNSSKQITLLIGQSNITSTNRQIRSSEHILLGATSPSNGSAPWNKNGARYGTSSDKCQTSLVWRSTAEIMPNTCKSSRSWKNCLRGSRVWFPWLRPRRHRKVTKDKPSYNHWAIEALEEWEANSTIIMAYNKEWIHVHSRLENTT